MIIVKIYPNSIIILFGVSFLVILALQKGIFFHIYHGGKGYLFYHPPSRRMLLSAVVSIMEFTLYNSDTVSSTSPPTSASSPMQTPPISDSSSIQISSPTTSSPIQVVTTVNDIVPILPSVSIIPPLQAYSQCQPTPSMPATSDDDHPSNPVPPSTPMIYLLWSLIQIC